MSMVISIGKVMSTYDDADGLRIQARVTKDRTEETLEAFPLLPKTFQMVPKVGEAVLILFSQPNNSKSQRYYIGPIIPQPQYMEKAPYNFGQDSIATMLLEGSVVKHPNKISNYATTEGAFPDKEDVAIVGRHSEDIILKEKEIDIRCGIRTKPVSNSDNDGLFGDVVFNSTNPGYIQMKYRQNGKSIINVVSDKVNILSHGQAHKSPVNLVNSVSKNISITEYLKESARIGKPEFGSSNSNGLIKESEMDALMDTLHPIPYGDKIKEAFDIIIQAIETHTHSFPGMPPLGTTSLMLGPIRHMDLYNPDIRIN